MKDVTKEEALCYNKDDLIKHIEKRKNNIKIFEKAIYDEENEILRENQMIKIIEAHDDIKDRFNI